MPSTSFELNSEVVRAGAGAGKTTALTQRVLDVARAFFVRHQRAPRVVVTTFTRKATEELRERLVRRACESGEEPLIQFVTSRSHLQISTIHGVLSQFLQRFGHLLGIDSGFQVVDSKSIERLASQTLRELLKSHPDLSLLEDYRFSTLVQMLRISVPEGATPVTTDDLREAIFSNLRHVADELLETARAIADETKDEKWAAYAKHLEACALYLHDQVETLNLEDWVHDFESHKKPTFRSQNPAFSFELNDQFEKLRKRCKELSGHEYNTAFCEQFANRARVFANLKADFEELFENKKRQSGYVEFDDLERLSHKALIEHPEVISAFSSDWDYWLIDEFQDTSPIQTQLLGALVGQKPVYVVGDPQQSIYIFRGARSEVFAEKEEQIVRDGGKRSELLKNYRSRPELLLFFNDFFAQVSSDFMPMEPKAPTTQDVADPVVYFYVSPADAGRSHGLGDRPLVGEQSLNVAPLSTSAPTPYAPLAQFILTRISDKNEKFDDFCVLARTRSELYAVAQYLNALGIPTHVHSNDGFYSRREILDLLSMTKFLLNPHDNENLIRLLRSPWVRVSDAQLAAWVPEKKDSFWNEMLQFQNESEPLAYLANCLEQASRQGVFEIVRRFALERGLLVSSHYHDSTGRRESNIWKYLHKLSEGERTPGFQYQKFIFEALRSAFEFSGDEGESDAVAALEPNRVNLMTIHKSKGLKFKHVLLPNINKAERTSKSKMHTKPFVYDEYSHKFHLQVPLGEERKLEHSLLAQEYFIRFSEQESEENLRLLYVALTRAEHSVVLQWQEPAAEKSWVRFCQPWLVQEGLNTSENYAYKVCHRFAEPKPYVEAARIHGAARSKWSQNREPKRGDVLPRISVTQLLERNSSGKKAASGASASSVVATIATAPSAISTAPNVEALNRQLQAPVFGQRLHSFFESLQYHARWGDYSVDQILSRYMQRWLTKEAGEFRAAVEYVLKLDEPPIRELIQTGFVEWGFQLKTENEILEGQIDLWGVVGNTLWVVDYKSGGAHHVEKAYAQLACYARALRAYGHTQQVQLAVVFAREEKVSICDRVQLDEI